MKRPRRWLSRYLFRLPGAWLGILPRFGRVPCSGDHPRAWVLWRGETSALVLALPVRARLRPAFDASAARAPRGAAVALAMALVAVATLALSGCSPAATPTVAQACTDLRAVYSDMRDSHARALVQAGTTARDARAAAEACHAGDALSLMHSAFSLWATSARYRAGDLEVEPRHAAACGVSTLLVQEAVSLANAEWSPFLAAIKGSLENLDRCDPDGSAARYRWALEAGKLAVAGIHPEAFTP